MKAKGSPPPPNPEPGFIEVMGAISRPGVLWNIPVHLFILIPTTCFIAWLARRIDAHFGLEPFIDQPWNVLVFAILFPLGIFIVWYTYGYLAIMGEGSPATHLGGTKRLVTTGPFTLCRHPSIIGKFVGVVSFGLLVGSPVFFFVIIPFLTCYSLMTARFLQERFCVKLWGGNYLEYRKSIPLIIPRPSAVRDLFGKKFKRGGNATRREA